MDHWGWVVARLRVFVAIAYPGLPAPSAGRHRRMAPDPVEGRGVPAMGVDAWSGVGGERTPDIAWDAAAPARPGRPRRPVRPRRDQGGAACRHQGRAPLAGRRRRPAAGGALGDRPLLHRRRPEPGQGGGAGRRCLAGRRAAGRDRAPVVAGLRRRPRRPGRWAVRAAGRRRLGGRGAGGGLERARPRGRPHRVRAAGWLGRAGRGHARPRRAPGHRRSRTQRAAPRQGVAAGGRGERYRALSEQILAVLYSEVHTPGAPSSTRARRTSSCSGTPPRRPCSRTSG